RLLGADFTSATLGGSQDAIGHWTSKLFDKKWQLDASLSYHRERVFHDYAVSQAQDLAPRVQWGTDPVADTNVNPRQGAGPSLSWFINSEKPQFRDAILANCDTVMAPSGLTPGSIKPTRPQDAMLNVVCPVGGNGYGVVGYGEGGRGSWSDLVA